MARGKRQTQTRLTREGTAYALADALATGIGLAVKEVLPLLGPPPRPELGDVALATHKLARELGRPAPEVALELAQLAETLDSVEEASAMGPFVNVRFAAGSLAAEAFAAVKRGRRQKGGLLHGREGQGQTLVLDYSSPNAARKLAFHHLRGTVVGEALARLYEARGYKVLRINHLGDFGHNIGLLLHKVSSVPEELEVLSPSRLQELYVEVNQEAAADEAVKESAYRWLKRLGNEEEEAVRLWSLIIDATRRELEQTYDRLGVRFDEYRGESGYVGVAHLVAQELLQMGVAAKNEEGTIFVPGDETRGLRPIVLETREGLTTYESRDLAAALERYDEYAYDRAVYLTDVGQQARFEAVFNALKESESPAGEGAQHVGFGQMRLGGKKSKSREGTSVSLDEVLDAAEAQARAVLSERLDTLDDPDEVARQVGVGAVIFSQVKMRRSTDFDFDLEAAVSLQGQTAPRIQYSYARIRSIIAKGETTLTKALAGGDDSLLTHPLERAALKQVLQVKESGAKALAADDPSYVADALLSLTEAWAAYQTAGKQDPSLRVLCDEPALRASRLKLAAAVGRTLEDGLALLGVAAPERM